MYVFSFIQLLSLLLVLPYVSIFTYLSTLCFTSSTTVQQHLAFSRILSKANIDSTNSHIVIQLFRFQKFNLTSDFSRIWPSINSYWHRRNQISPWTNTLSIKTRTNTFSTCLWTLGLILCKQLRRSLLENELDPAEMNSTHQFHYFNKLFW